MTATGQSLHGSGYALRIELPRDRREAGAVVRISQLDPQLALDPRIVDPPVVAPEAERHRRELANRSIEGYERRRLDSKEMAGMRDDVGRGGRLVVADVVDAPGVGLPDGC